jgi:Xaa-Pro aminopeptidase
MAPGPNFLPEQGIKLPSFDQDAVRNSTNGLINTLVARHQARQMRDHQMNIALAQALGQIHTAEATVRVQSLKNEGEIALQQGAHEQELKMAQQGRHTIRTQADADIRRTYAEGLEARARIGSEAIAARGEADQAMPFLSEMADKGHAVEYELNRGQGVKFKITPRQPSDDSEDELSKVFEA